MSSFLEARTTAPVEIVVIALLAILASFAVMSVNLGTKAFWVDESIAVLPAKSIHSTGLPKSPFDLNYMSHQLEDGLWDPSAPLYRYGVAAFTAVVGFSETTTRAFSMLMGLTLLVPCFLLFRRVYGDTTAWIAVAVMASLPSFAEHCREARHFTFVACAMYASYCALASAGLGDSMRARAWWPVLLMATVLGHYVGYLSLPVVGVYLLATWGRPLLARRYIPLYSLLFLAYAALQAKFWNTLPFFYSVGCHNRHPGCEPNPLYYLGTIVEFLGGGPRITETAQGSDAFLMLPNLGPVIVLLLTGMVVAIRDGRRSPMRAEHLLVLSAFWIPLLLLSTQELKFPRYLFYVMPVLCLFVARGLVTILGARRLGQAGRWVLAAGFGLLLLGPEMVEQSDGHETFTTFESRFVRHARRTFTDTEPDTWQRTLAQVVYVQQNAGPDDIVVTSFDDASLSYYTGRFVHGFLNSDHDDQYFLDLLRTARENGVKLYLIDMLPEQNYCHTQGVEVFTIDCRDKYRGFYTACLPRSPTYDPTCVRRYFR